MTLLFLKAYIPAVCTIIILDLLWLGFLMRDFYQTKLAHLVGKDVVWGAAICFYLLFAAGLVYFAVMPALAKGSLVQAILLGAGIGLLAYGTYDLTNHATLREWPISVTAVDMIWGAVISGAAASVGFLVATFLNS